MLLVNELQQANVMLSQQNHKDANSLLAAISKNGPQEVSLDKCVAFHIVYNVNFLYFVSMTHIS